MNKYLILLLCFIATPVTAKLDAKRTSVLMRVVPDARSASMGGSGTASNRITLPLFWNPAGMSDFERRKISFAHGELLLGIQKEFLEYVHPITRAHFVGGAVIGTDYGSIPRTQIDQYNEPITDLGSFTGSDLAIRLGYAYKFSPSLRAGFSLSFYEKDLDAHDDRSFIFEAGALYMLPWWKIRSGFAISNVGPGVKLVSQTNRLPLTYRFGLSKPFWDDRILFQMDLEKPVDRGVSINLGGEFQYVNWFKLRAGWNNALDRISTGIGITWRGIDFDYAFIPFDAFGDMHRISFGVEFGEAVKPPIAPKYKLEKPSVQKSPALNEKPEPQPPDYLFR